MKYLIVLFLLFLNLYGFEYNIKSGWQLFGTQSEIKVDKFTNPSISTVWIYRNNKWYCYANSSALKNKLKEFNISSFEYILPKEGFWVYSKGDFILDNFISSNSFDNYLSLKKGWQLVSLPFDKKIEMNDLNISSIDIVWKFSNNNWKAFSPKTDTENLIKKSFQEIDFILPTEGFWIKSNSDFNLTFSSYNIYLFDILNGNEIKPLRFADIYDEYGNKIGKSDFYGHITISKPVKIFLSDKYDFKPIIMNKNKKDYVLIAQKIQENNETNNTYIQNSDKLIDIKDYRLGPQEPLSIIAAIIPKVFVDSNYSYGLIVRKFYANQDVTLSIKPTKAKNAIGAFKIGLEDSYANEITPEYAQFSGEFKPFMKYDGNETNFILMINKDGDWKFLSNAYVLNGKIYSKKYINEFGEYAFFIATNLYKHTVCSNVKSIIFDSNFYPRVANKCSSFYSSNKDENITIFAPGYEQISTIVDEDVNITLKKKQFTNKIKIFKPFKIFQTSAVTYSDIVKEKFIYNWTSGSKLYDINTSMVLNMQNLYFNSYAISSKGIVFADMGGNLYFYDENNSKLNKTEFSSEDFLENIGNFVNKGVSDDKNLFFPTTNGYIIITTLDGNNSYESPIKLKSYDDNLSNDLVYMYDINKTNSYALSYEGEIYMLDKSDRNTTLITSTSASLNAYNTDYKNSKLYYIDDKKLNYIEKFKIVKTQINGNRVKITQNYILVENNGFINIYDNSLNLIKKVNGNKLLKAFEINNNLIIVTENEIYIDDEKVTFNDKISNADYQNGIFLVELKNGKNYLLQ